MESEIAEIKQQLSALQKELSRVSGGLICITQVQNLAQVLTKHKQLDEAEVRKTHFKYGYYLDKCLYDEVSRHHTHSIKCLGVC